MKLYMLKSGRIVYTDNTVEWAKWFNNIDNRRIGYDKIGDVEISTVFLGIDHGGTARRLGDLVLFETMVFGDSRDETCVRYTSLASAKKGHRAMRRRVMRSARKQESNLTDQERAAQRARFRLIRKAKNEDA